MNLRTALILGRVSNLPTVWSNALTGWVLAGGGPPDRRWVLAAVALSSSYVGGMFLNDAFDWRIDARERPERPIASGRATPVGVALGGAMLLAAGLILLAWLGVTADGLWNPRPAVMGLLLAAAILYYDWRHKRDPLSPVWMGVCRALAVLVAATVAAPIVPPVAYVAAVLILCYLIGLTYVAKQETLTEIAHLWPLAFIAVAPLYCGFAASDHLVAWATLALMVAWTLHSLSYLWRRRPGDIGRAVAALIAGISLLDACLIASAGAARVAAVAVVAFGVSRILQRYVPAT